MLLCMHERMLCMKPVGTRPIRTARLLLRPPTSGDAEALVRIRSLAMPLPDAKRAMAELLQEQKKPFCFHWLITLEGLVIGRIRGWDIHPYNGYLQLGYDIGSEYRGQGYMPEAMRAVLQYLFEEAKANRVFCSVRAGNHPSIRVCEKCGMIKEGVLREHYARQDGGYDDVLIYGVLQSEYKKGAT